MSPRSCPPGSGGELKRGETEKESSGKRAKPLTLWCLKIDTLFDAFQRAFVSLSLRLLRFSPCNCSPACAPMSDPSHRCGKARFRKRERESVRFRRDSNADTRPQQFFLFLPSFVGAKEKARRFFPSLSLRFLNLETLLSLLASSASHRERRHPRGPEIQGTK